MLFYSRVSSWCCAVCVWGLWAVCRGRKVESDRGWFALGGARRGGKKEDTEEEVEKKRPRVRGKVLAAASFLPS